MMAGPTLDLGNLLIHFKADITQYSRMMRTVENQMRSVSQSMTRIGRQMTLRVTAPIILMGTASVKAFANFDDAMTKSLAIMSDITPKIRQEMESLALTISEQGVTSATELAKSYFFLASAGLDAKQSMAALAAVNNFAIAGAFDMATATDLATDAQSALGLTVKDAQQNLVNMTRVTDVLTGANTLANASTEQFALALTSQAGPAMKAYGIELEEGVAVLAAFADQGIKAQNAGNLFSRMLRLMTKGFMDNTIAWKRFNINIFDATGALKPMATIVGDITNAIGDLSTEAKIAALDILGFQARSQQAILPLLGMQDAIAEYTQKLKEMNGITKEVADKQLKSFTSQMIILKNQVVNVSRDIGRRLAPMILKLNKRIKFLVKEWKRLNDSTKNAILIFTGVVAAIGPVLIVLGLLAKAILFIGSTLTLLLAHPAILVFAAIATAVGLVVKSIIDHNIEIAKAKKALDDLNITLTEGKEKWDKWDASLRKSAKGLSLLRQKTVLTNELTRLNKDLDTALTLEKNVGTGLREIIDLQRRIGSPRSGFESGAVIIRNSIKLLRIEIERTEKLLDVRADRAVKLIEKIKKAEGFTGPPAPDAPPEKKPFFDFDTKTFNERVQEWVDSARDISNNIADAFTSGLDRLSQGISAALFRAEVDFIAIAQSIAQEVTTQVIRSAIASATSSFLDIGGDAKREIIAAQDQATALVNQTSSITNMTAATINQAAAATMLTAASTISAAQFGGASIARPFHTGGMVGGGGPSRIVPASTFIGAPRLHRGLAGNEFASILERGEVVLDKNNVAEMKSARDRGVEDSGRGGTVNNNFYISAIDSKGVAGFFKKYRRQVANAQATSSRENNRSARRG